MKIKKLIPVFCLALGLTFALPLSAGATGANTETKTTESETETPTEKSGWHKDSAGRNWYFVKEDGTRLTGFATIDKVNYYFDGNGYLTLGTDGPVKIGNNLYFIHANGSVATAGWKKAGNKNYYVKTNAGNLAANQVLSISGKLYAFDMNGYKITSTGFQIINQKTYYLKKGTVQIGRKKIKGTYYFFNNKGVMRTTATIKYNKKLYYVAKNGSMRSGWFKVDGKRYYANKNGILQTGWQKYKNKWYYFSPKNGTMQYGWMVSKGKSYYLNPKTGVMKTGWFKIGKNKYYGTPSGASMGARYEGFQTINGKKYYFTNKGVQLHSGFKKIGSKKYYMSSKGVIATGWKKVSGKYYYFNSDGSMKTGWFIYKGKYYYLDPKTGVMATGKRTIDGVTYTFSASGASNREIPGSYSIRVNRQRNVLTVYKGGIAVKAMLCSTGLNNATPAGNFRVLDKLYLHELNGPTFGYYCSHITPDILFHSIPAPTTDRSKIPSYKFNMLGQQASEGCIRLAMGDAYWLYVNIPVGTPVTVYDSADPGPLGKPANIYMSTNPAYGYDPTDPNR